MQKKFLNFLNDLIDDKNINSIDIIKRGFRTVFESSATDDYMVFNWGQTPRDVFDDQFYFYTSKDGGNGFYYLEPGTSMLDLLNKISFEHEVHVGNKLAFTKDTLWDLLKKMENYDSIVPFTREEMRNLDILRQDILRDLRIEEN